MWRAEERLTNLQGDETIPSISLSSKLYYTQIMNYIYALIDLISLKATKKPFQPIRDFSLDFEQEAS